MKQCQGNIMRFWIKIFFITIPFIPIIILYFIKDPYMRLYSYKRFDNSKVMLDEAYVGWQNILMNKDSLKYDSFILGNSCTMAFNTHEWEKYLGKSSVAARFFDNGEGIGGVCQKLEALDSIGLQLHNIMIILDRKSFADVYPQTRSYNLFSPEIAKISKIEFMLTVNSTSKCKFRELFHKSIDWVK